MDPFVELARLSIQHYVLHHSVLDVIPVELVSVLKGQKAGVFVSIHTTDGSLRGCMGTLGPRQADVTQEIICNATTACAHDPRFPPVHKDELAHLDIRVDVLSELEPAADATHLDPRRYGLLVTANDGRRGVLLPDLEGINTVAEQIAISCRKAGIDPIRESYSLQRFTVTRHTEPD